MAWPPTVEQWRPLIEQHFPSDLVDKALHVINYESSGDAACLGDNGFAIGLFQIHCDKSIAGGPTKEWLLVPENNIQYAAENLGAASGRWTDWGEGALFQGHVFGALGNHPYRDGGPVADRAAGAADPTHAPAASYVVKSGDTLSGIGQRLGVDWHEMARLNGLVDPFVLVPGESLKVPGGAAGASAVAPAQFGPAAVPSTYIVKAGDTLSGIGSRLGVAWREIARANNLADPFRIVPGQALVIPAPQQSSPPGGSSASG